MRINVPSVVKSGDTVTLSCQYDLEEVALYSIKWYRNEEEFYRFVPKESPPFRAFNVMHVIVDISRSGPTDVTLRGVSRELTGDYKCEVSADAPFFHTDIKVASMIVVELPTTDIVLNTEPKMKVEIGKRITAICFCSGSDPAPNITWHINDGKVNQDNFKGHIYPLEIKLDKVLKLKSSTSKLELIANRFYFVAGLMSIKCEASIYSIWNQSAETIIKEENLQLAPILGTTSSQSHVDQVIEIITSSSDENYFTNNKSKNVLIQLLFLFVFLR